MNVKLKRFVVVSGLLVSTGILVTSCIREQLPEIGVDVTGVDLQNVYGFGIIKATVQETSVTLYAESMEKMKNVDLTFQVSTGATASFVEVVQDSSKTAAAGGAYVSGRDSIWVVSIKEISKPTDFSKTQYIKVVSQASGLNEDDFATQKLIDAQVHNPNDPSAPSLLGWEKDGKRYRQYVEGAHLYKIWSISALPAGIPLSLTFDNWYNPVGTKFKQPFEYVDGSENHVWSSTNASIALMANTNQLVTYGAAPALKADGTPDVAPVRGAENKSALMLTSNDIRYTKTLARPYLAGCCFIGEFDGSDTGALTCTHVGLPFNKAPESLSFWYKYLPLEIRDPNTESDLEVLRPLWLRSGQTADGSFNVPGIESYIGKKDKCFVRAVLYRADGDTKWLNGESIRLFPTIAESLTTHSQKALGNIVAWAEFSTDETVSDYTKITIPFTYVNGYTLEDLKTSKDLVNWKYNLAIYFASSYDGFRFICGANMIDQLQGKRYTEQMGTKFYIDEMEINCDE